MAFVKVAKTGEIAPGEGKAVNVGVRRIALFNIGGVYHASDDTCTHRGGPLSEGMVVGTDVTCPWHGAVFDVTWRLYALLGVVVSRQRQNVKHREVGAEVEHAGQKGREPEFPPASAAPLWG